MQPNPFVQLVHSRTRFLVQYLLIQSPIHHPSDDIQKSLCPFLCEMLHCRIINNAKFDPLLITSNYFSMVVGVNPCKFVSTIDRFIMEDTVQLESELQTRNENIQLCLNGICAVEMEFELGV